MTYYLLASCLAFALFFSINLSGSLITTALWFGLRRHAGRWTASTRAGIIFLLRTLPPVCSLAFVAALMLPAYFIHEPYPAPETIGFALFALALYSAIGIARACLRIISTWRATQRLKSAWLRRAAPVNLGGVTVPAYLLKHPTPLVAVVGALNPTLFIAEQVLDSLSQEELEVALAHEKGHLVRRDTLRRAVMNFCADLLPLIGGGRTLDRAWAVETERAADEYAARRGAANALDLAAAIIKIARLMPVGVNHVVPGGAFLIEGDNDGVAGRVQRLTELASTGETPVVGEPEFSKSTLTAVITTITLALETVVADWQVLATVHIFTERIVKLLA